MELLTNDLILRPVTESDIEEISADVFIIISKHIKKGDILWQIWIIFTPERFMLPAMRK